MKILVIGQFHPLEITSIHYSSIKGLQMAKGFQECGCETYLFTREMEGIDEDIHLIPYNKIDKTFIDTLDVIVFCLEAFVSGSLKLCPPLKQYIFAEKNKKAITVCRMDGHTWMNKTEDWNTTSLLERFNFITLQNDRSLNAFKFACPPNTQFNDKVFTSSMGVPTSIPYYEQCPFTKKPYNLIYMGRMRQTKDRLKFLVDIMSMLDDNYHLNILPGSFNKPDDIQKKKFSPDYEESLEWLVNYFSISNRITVYPPITWGKHWKYLQHSDCGIDFSASGNEIPTKGDNAKLLEYLAIGLPVVTELGPGNLDLVRQSNGGLIFNGIGEPKDFANLIKQCVNITWNRKAISDNIISTESWKVKCQDILNKIQKSNEKLHNTE